MEPRPVISPDACSVCGRPGRVWVPFDATLCDRHARDAFERTGLAADGVYLASVHCPWVAGPEYDSPGPQPATAHLLVSPPPADVHVGLTIPCLVQTGDVVPVEYVWGERQEDPYDAEGHTAHFYYRAIPVGPLPRAVAAICEPVREAPERIVYPGPPGGVTVDDVFEALHGDDDREMAAQMTVLARMTRTGRQRLALHDDVPGLYLLRTQSGPHCALDTRDVPVRVNRLSALDGMLWRPLLSIAAEPHGADGVVVVGARHRIEREPTPTVEVTGVVTAIDGPLSDADVAAVDAALRRTGTGS